MKLTTMLRPLRRVPAEAKAADLRATLKEAEADRGVIQAELDALDAALGEVLLDGDPDASKAHEDAVREGRDQIKRVEAMIGALHPRIAAADERETEAFLQTQTALAERLAAEAVVHVLAYEKAAREMLAAAEELNAATEQVTKMNLRMREHRRPDLCVMPPLNRVWQHNRNDKLTGLQVLGPRRLARTLAEYEKALAETPPPPRVHAPSIAELAEAERRSVSNEFAAFLGL